ncbi:hypothetical protein EMIT0P176_50231 [Pseudomonas sp. IT-P176]
MQNRLPGWRQIVTGLRDTAYAVLKSAPAKDWTVRVACRFRQPARLLLAAPHGFTAP